MSGRIKVGIIGFGKMGQIRKGVVDHNPDLSLEAICDPVLPAQNETPECKMLRDYRELLKEDLSAVLVCTPNKFTPEIVTSALNHNKHVFCEKPPGRNIDDIQSIIKAEQNNKGLKLKFGFNHRYHGAIIEAKAIIESGRLGKILWMRGIYGKSGGPNFEKTWRNQREIAGGGILLDQGIHMVDLFRMFCGDFHELKSFVTNSYWNTDVEDNAMAILRNNRGQIAMIHSSATQWKHTFSLEISLEEGYLIISGILSSTLSYGQGERLIVATKQPENRGFALGNPREELTYFNQDRSWELEIDDFVNCIKNDRPVTTGSSQDAVKAMEMVYRIYAADDKWGGRS
ncbi:MAG: Gfo/Idh/MocA family oxidoreductase [Dehalococcoidales bacterium]|jgi:predicted dehydrogenase